MPPRWPVGQCRVCLGWGEKPQYADCVACSSWRAAHPDRAPCRRCEHDSHVNTDGLCRLCLLVIRLHDPGWITNPVGGRACQLMLILPGDRLPRSQPLNRPLRGKAPDRTRPRSWLDQLRAAAGEPVDDPRICPPVIRGQRLLFRPRRRLTVNHARRIKDRDLADYDRLKQTAIRLATERGLSTAWWRGTCLMIRLALAIRDADGDDLIPEEALDDLPGFRNATLDVLRQASLTGAAVLRPRRRARPVVPAKPQRSCRHCDCWGFRTLCQECASWNHPARHPVGDCSRCSRPAVPLLHGICRACWVHIDTHGPSARTQSWTQLWLGGPLAPRLAMRTGTLGYIAPHHKARARAAARRPPPSPISPHLLNPAQGTLFDVRRDWSYFATGSLDQLPSLTPAAHALLEEFQQHVRSRGCDEQVRRIAARSLRILLAWLGADAPIPEADIWALPADRPGTSARHVLHFLTARALVIPDPVRQADSHHQAIQSRIQELPAGIADELRRWVLVLRGEGRREHRPMPFETIRKYLGYLHPVLTLWSGRVTSLREITSDDIRHVLTQRPGQPAQDLASALRSLFQALKQERLIFRDPTRGISLPAVVRLPVPIPTDRLRGLIDRTGSAMAKLVIALVAIHGLGKRETAQLLLTDLDLPGGTLTVRRELGRHTVYLDELTHTLMAGWLRERHHRWPLTTNPHLLLSQQTATMDTQPTISSMVMNDIFRPLGLSPSKLRQDRILDEARHTADPVHLMRVFGITARTAMKYVFTAHPERRSTLPR
jgi:site-specific recombinase XerD